MKTVLYTTIALLTSLSLSLFYPIDGYETTGIKRLYQIKKMQDEGKKYTRIPFGAYKKLEDINR